MSLIILEGLDRTGKTTVAEFYKTRGFELIHLSAPPKGTTRDQYLQSMVDIISSAASKNIVMDRSHWGELVWSQVYNRNPVLLEEDFEIIREMESSVDTKRILMYDPNPEEHWKRCVENNEPLTKPQFVKARALFSQLAHNHGFESITLPQFLKEFPDAKQVDRRGSDTADVVSGTAELSQTVNNDATDNLLKKARTEGQDRSLTAEQIKLEKANIINEILSKRILKTKGLVYDELENELRMFLNNKLSKLLGGSSQELTLTSEEIAFYKKMYKRAISK